MKIAVDICVGNSSIDYLNNHGFKVVYRPFQTELDNLWFAKAVERGAEVFASADWDISFLCNKYNKKFVKLKQGMGGTAIGEFIAKQIEKGKFS